MYKKAEESYRDHSDFLQKSRYAFLFDLKPTDYKGWAKGLKKAGYATNPKYPELLIKLLKTTNCTSLIKAKSLGSHQNPKKKYKEAIVTNEPIQGDYAIAFTSNDIKYVIAKAEVKILLA